MARFGLVLGGGGYAGIAFHAAVLTSLARAGWDAREAEIIVGTSAGATSAALIRVGFPPRDYVNLILGEPMSAEAVQVLAGTAAPAGAPLRSQRRLRPASRALVRRRRSLPFGVLMAGLLPEGVVDAPSVLPTYGPRFDSWPHRPTWITAVDLGHGRRVVFGRTEHATLPQAVAASIAIPGYFSPVVIDGVRYVDGGAWSTNNADLLVGADVELVIVSGPSSTGHPAALDAPNLQRIPVRRTLNTEVAALRGDGKDVVVLHPDRAVRRVMGVNSMSERRQGAVALASLTYAKQAIADEPLLRRG